MASTADSSVRDRDVHLVGKYPNTLPVHFFFATLPNLTARESSCLQTSGGTKRNSVKTRCFRFFRSFSGGNQSGGYLNEWLRSSKTSVSLIRPINRSTFQCTP